MKHLLLSLCILGIIFSIGCKNTSNKDETTQPNIDLKPKYEEVIELPKFPIPYPKPSTLDILPKTAFQKCETLGDIDNILSKTLNRCDYYRKSYFQIPNGFALVTRLEKFNEDGSPKPDNERWVDIGNNNNSNLFSIKDYLKSLFTARPGHYRCIAFLISDQIFFSKNDIIKSEKAQAWINEGGLKLTDELFEMKVNSNYDVIALIYEFKKLEHTNEAKLISPSNIQGKTHLRKSNILAYLN